MKNSVKNIIFDFGGVVFQIDETRTYKAFADLFKTPYSDFVHQFDWQAFRDFECGRISPEEMFDRFRRLTRQQVSDEQILGAWNAILVGYPKEHVDLLLKLKERYRTFLLSNTNELHTREFVKIAARQKLPIRSNHDLFEKVWYSNELGMRKPDPEIFRFALKDAGLDAGETLFVDDLPENVEAAKSVGIHAIQITKDCGIMQLFGDWAE